MKCNYCQSDEPCYDGFTLCGNRCQHPEMEAKVLERAESLKHAVDYGPTNGKRNMIVDLDLLDALLRGKIPVGNNAAKTN
jgi:hypothetical protein